MTALRTTQLCELLGSEKVLFLIVIFFFFFHSSIGTKLRAKQPHPSPPGQVCRDGTK